MPKSDKKKPLGTWPDSKKHQAVKTPQEEGEQSQSGHMSDPEEVEEKDTLDAAKDAGLYSGYDEEHQGELGVAEEEDKDLKTEEET